VVVAARFLKMVAANCTTSTGPSHFAGPLFYVPRKFPPSTNSPTAHDLDWPVSARWGRDAECILIPMTRRSGNRASHVCRLGYRLRESYDSSVATLAIWAPTPATPAPAAKQDLISQEVISEEVIAQEVIAEMTMAEANARSSLTASASAAPAATSNGCRTYPECHNGR
jgi:hypothetical protein